jgi:very-short-patch-repair endonuclease
MTGGGCQKCGFESISKSKLGNTNDFIKASKVVHGEKYDYSLVDYKLNFISVKIICPKHGEFIQSPASHLRGSGCPSCNESTAEKLVSDILSRYNLYFLKQHKFEDCINKKEGRFCRKLPFDFYLPNTNTCIEYDGRQHFEPIDTFGGEQAFQAQKINDNIKNEYCRKNGIKLIRIPYTMSPEEVETYLSEELGLSE